MGPFGFTRTSVQSDHALITPESHVQSTLHNWERTSVTILISPEMGTERRARFTQYLAAMEVDAVGRSAPKGIERVLYLLEGRISINVGSRSQELEPGGFAFLPAGVEHEVVAVEPSRLNLFEKRYQPLAGTSAPAPIVGSAEDVRAEPFLGDEDAMLKTLLPTDLSFDLAVNVFTFNPGAALPLVEVHVMEHGLLMLQGKGIYRLADRWYPVQAGDVIWMASYCPQWFAAVGKSQAGYLYYKDVNRYPLEEVAR